MSAWLDLLIKELVLLVLLGGLGCGIACHLRVAGGIGSRIALAPVFGLALGSAALTTAAYVMPMRVAAWTVLVPLLAVSIAVGIRALRQTDKERAIDAQARPYRRRRSSPPRALDLLQLAGIVLVVTTAFNYPIASRPSLGPMGYRVADAAGYVATVDGLERHTLQDDRWGPAWDLSSQYAGGIARGFQHLGFDTLAASVNAALGWEASETQSAFMVALILVGALGLFAGVRALTGTRTWAASLAALLFAGPLVYQLFIESSEGALAGLALVAPIGVVAALVLRQPSLANVVSLGVLIAGLQTVYPLFVPPLVIGASIVVAARALASVKKRLPPKNAAARAAALLGATAAIAIALSPVAFERSVRYWHNVATGGFLDAAAVGLPVYDLNAPIVPSYVLQTREFYFLSGLADTSLQQLVLGYLAPLFLAALIVYGIWRYRAAWVLLPGILAAALLAYYTSTNRDCSYCTQRNLLVIGPLAAALVGVGVAAVAARGHAFFKWAALVGGIGVLILAAHKSSVLARRAVEGGYALPAGVRDLLDELDARRGPLYLEAAGAGFGAAFEMPFLYHATNEATGQRLAVDVEDNDYRGLTYLGGPRSRGPEFVSNYRWVLTRVAGIETKRSTVARQGPFALQERRRPVDITVARGVVVDTFDRDHEGQAWVQGPLRFWVSGPTEGPVSARVELTGTAAVRAKVPARARVLARRPGALFLCTPVVGSGDFRRLDLPIRFRVPPAQPPPETFGAPWIPGKALRLAAMSATTGSCPKDTRRSASPRSSSTRNGKKQQP
jgi:hypothetical protein